MRLWTRLKPPCFLALLNIYGKACSWSVHCSQYNIKSAIHLPLNWHTSMHDEKKKKDDIIKRWFKLRKTINKSVQGLAKLKISLYLILICFKDSLKIKCFHTCFKAK